MNREPVALDGCQDDHLEQIASAIRPDDQPTVGIFAGVLDRECIVDSMSDVRLHDTVLARRVVDLHRLIVLRKGSAQASVVIGSDPAPSRGFRIARKRECDDRQPLSAAPVPNRKAQPARLGCARLPDLGESSRQDERVDSQALWLLQRRSSRPAAAR